MSFAEMASMTRHAAVRTWLDAGKQGQQVRRRDECYQDCIRVPGPRVTGKRSAAIR